MPPALPWPPQGASVFPDTQKRKYGNPLFFFLYEASTKGDLLIYKIKKAYGKKMAAFERKTEKEFPLEYFLSSFLSN